MAGYTMSFPIGWGKKPGWYIVSEKQNLGLGYGLDG